MRKSALFSFIVLLAMIFSSCARKTKTAGRTATLKDRARILESGIEWSDDISAEGSQLSSVLSVSPSLLQEPLAHVVAFDFSAAPRNYPVLEGFASLDTSDYSEASYAVLNDFCRALETGKGEDSYMDKGFLFSLSLFKYGLGLHGKEKNKPVSHVIGKPDEKNNSLQCPVRLIYQDGSICDIYVYLVKSASDWKVNQIEFKKEEPEESS